jgi:hypothetical protein
MDKRTGIAAGALTASVGLAAAGVEALRRRAATRQSAPAVPGIRAETAIGRKRAPYSPGPRANPEPENAAVRRGQESLARVPRPLVVGTPQPRSLHA